MKKEKHLVLWAILSIVLILGVALYKYSMNSPWRISSVEAKKKLDKKEFDTILDVRTETERKTLGMYPNSIHIPSGELQARVEKELPNKKASILVYCNTGQRARMATEELHRLGYKNTRYIAGPHTSIL